MRPIELKISAFGPYANRQCLNFANGLAGSNLFLIHGPTGSGKTTILDAMLFALYGSNRIGNGRDAKMMRSEHADADTPTEVDFTFALGEKNYRVKRTFSPDLKKSSAEFYDLNGNYDVITKNVSEHIESLIGFGSEQFRQVILLQQGEFKKFLFSKTNERQGILDVLFNASFYKKVEEQLKKQSEIYKNELEKIQSQRRERLSEFEVESEEDLLKLIETTAEEVKQAQNLIQELDKSRKTARDELEKGRTLYQKFVEFAEEVDKLTAANKALEKTAGELQTAKVEYDKQKNLESERKLYEKNIDELKKIRDRLSEFQKAKKDLENAETLKIKKTAEIEKLNKTMSAYENRLNELVNETKFFSKSAADFEKYNALFKECEARDKLVKEIENLTAQIELAQKNSAMIEERRANQQRNVEQLKEFARLGRAALLAKDLQDGQPCPVCGSTIHPKLAVSKEIIPTDEEIQRSEAELDKLTKKMAAADKKLAEYNSKLQMQKETLAQKGDVDNTEEVKKKRQEAQTAKEKFKESSENFQKGQQFFKDVKDELKAKEDEYKQTVELAAKLKGSIKEMERQIVQQYRDEGGIQKLEVELKNATTILNEMMTAWTKAEKNYQYLERQLAAQKSTVNAVKEAHEKLAEALKDKVKPDIEALQKKSSEADSAWITQNKKTSELNSKSERLQKILQILGNMAKQSEQYEKDFAIWSRLSKVANGDNAQRMKFQTYILNAIFQQIIYEANQRLKIMSDERYRLEYKVPKKVAQNKFYGLDFEIYDEFTGTTRPVETLSGGESFLASLSLALGLADVVQNNAGGIKLDTIFIDEGFGTLDGDTLDMTIRALNDLQKDGRLVGIISHVEELKQQIKSKLEIIKYKTGSYAKFT